MNNRTMTNLLIIAQSFLLDVFAPLFACQLPFAAFNYLQLLILLPFFIWIKENFSS